MVLCLIKHGQLCIISHLYIQLMTEAAVALSVMQLATVRTVLVSNPSRGKRLSSSSKRPDLFLGPSGHIFNCFRGFFLGGKAAGM